MAEELPTVWGVVPAPIVGVLERLQARLAENVGQMSPLPLEGDSPREHDEVFQVIAKSANIADRVSSDYRSVFNAYVHRYHKPKPSIGDLARAQDTIIQTFAKRYTPKTIAAIDALLSTDPDLDALRYGIRTLGFEDLWGISGPLDAAMTRASKDPRFRRWPRNPR
jgi:hypothetical protein